MQERKNMSDLHNAAVALGRKGGLAKSERKAKSSRENGKRHKRKREGPLEKPAPNP
jgi:hypothetical protein